MATYFGEIIEPSSRALFEDCSDEETDVKADIELNLIGNSQESLPAFNTFIVAFGRLALAFVEAFAIDSDHTVVGEVKVFDNKGGKIASKTVVKSSPLVLQGDSLVCFVQSAVPLNLAYDFPELLSSILLKSKEVIILTNESLGDYKTRINERHERVNSVYSLKTNLYKSPLRPALNEANILSGLPAGVLTWCEINDVPAVVYICYSDSDVLDSVTAEPLRGLIPCRSQYPDLKRQFIFGGGARAVAGLSNMYM